MKKRKGLIAAVVFIILVTAINQFLNYALVQPGLGRTMFYECKIMIMNVLFLVHHMEVMALTAAK